MSTELLRSRNVIMKQTCPNIERLVIIDNMLRLCQTCSIFLRGAIKNVQGQGPVERQVIYKDD